MGTRQYVTTSRRVSVAIAAIIFLLGSALAHHAEANPTAEVPPAVPVFVEPVAAPDGAVVTDDIPEEILRTEIITAARSPLTGEPMSAAEYAQLVDELRSPAGTPLVSQDIRYLIYLLQIRRAIKPIVPFL